MPVPERRSAKHCNWFQQGVDAGDKALGNSCRHLWLNFTLSTNNQQHPRWLGMDLNRQH